MLPSNAISAAPVVAPFLAPDLTDTALLESLESGGVALNDASQGRLLQTWRAVVSEDRTSISVAPLSGSPVTTLVTGAVDITAVSLAFDAAMQPAVAYIEGGTLRLRWYDSVAEAFATDSFGPVSSMKLAADDKRPKQEGASDVILGYVRGTTLYWRQQRDRYETERTVGPAASLQLRRMGMHAAGRFQFELRPAD